MAIVYIPTTLRIFTNQRSELELSGSTVGEVIRNLSDEYPETAKALYDENGDLRSFINVFLGDENIKNLGLEGTVCPTLALYNSFEDIDALVNCIRAIAH